MWPSFSLKTILYFPQEEYSNRLLDLEERFNREMEAARRRDLTEKEVWYLSGVISPTVGRIGVEATPKGGACGADRRVHEGVCCEGDIIRYLMSLDRSP